MATPWTDDERKQRQYDILWNTLADNELLPYSAISASNKQLTTDNKLIIKAINELVTKLGVNNTTVENFTSVFNDNIGNPELDTTDWANLRTIDTNVIKAIYKVYQDLQSHGHALNDLSDVDTSTTTPFEGAVLKFSGGAWSPSTDVSGSGGAEQIFVVHDSFVDSVSKNYTFSQPIYRFSIFNDAATDLIFSIGTVQIDVKSKETFEGIFDPFTTVAIQATGSYSVVGEILG